MKQKALPPGRKEVAEYIKRIERIHWFQPNPQLTKEQADRCIQAVLDAFAIQAPIEYKPLYSPADWEQTKHLDHDVTWSIATNTAMRLAKYAVMETKFQQAFEDVYKIVRQTAIKAARHSADTVTDGNDAPSNAAAAWNAAWSAVRGATDLVAQTTGDKEYKRRYPAGNFLRLVELFELGLYPAGVVGGKFVCYVPGGSTSFWQDGPAAAPSDNPQTITIGGVEYELKPRKK